MDKKWTRPFYILLILNTILRFIIAFFTNLGIDEAYYFSYGLYLDWSYFDHPPMIGLLARASSWIFGYGTEAGFRALSVITGTLNLILVFQIAKTIKDRSAGFYAALLYSASFYGSVISGSFVLPDNPLCLFWLLSIYFIIKMLYNYKPQWSYIIFFGITAGLAFLSKYSALFLWGGIICFAIKYRKSEILKSPYWYYAALISAFFFLPVILWNYHNGFASFTFHSNRVSFEHLSIKLDYFATELFGQLFYNNPVNIFIIISCFVYLFRNKKTLNNPAITFLLFVSLPIISTTLIISLFNKTLPHWSGPGYIGLIILSAVILREKIETGKNTALKPGLISNFFFLIIVLLGLLQINSGIIDVDHTEDQEKLGKNDISLDMYGWHQVKDKTTNFINTDLSAQKTDSNYIFITHNWFPAGSIEFYLAYPLKKKVYIWGNKEKAHQYMKINELRGGIIKNSDAYYITTSRYFKAPDDNLANNYETANSREVIHITRNSKTVYNVFIYRLINAKNNFAINTGND
ncbi:MAG TPA: glycosyltransferase family 39 protein [Bacteroidales bacterium]|nr:glycosyltransferase family 39 protein [Bacteroidales bacterium]